MFASFKPSVGAYAQVELEGRVASADAHGLIVMLFDGAIMSLNHASAALEKRDIAHKAKSISRAINIIADGLRASVDTKAGGKLGVKLDELYAYMVNRLLLANARSDGTMVEEVKNLLIELRGAWVQIKDRAAVAQPARVAGR